jgi:hypothetical protein
MKKIIITEEQFNFINNNKEYIVNNSVSIFNSEIRNFIYCIIKHENNNISDYWKINGIKNGDLFRLLKKYNIIEETIDGEILVPKKNFDKKINRLYYDFFEDENPGIVMTEDDGGAGSEGGASCSSVGGDYEMPVFGLQRRRLSNM